MAPTPQTTGVKRDRPMDDSQGVILSVPEEMALPGASIMRIVRSKLPENVMINKEAKAAFAKACSIFIVYISTM